MRLHGTTVTCLFTLALTLCVTMSVASPTLAVGSSPMDPIPFDPSAGPVPVTISSGDEVWLSVGFVQGSTVSHITLETQGSVDTVLTVFANLSEALEDAPLAEDDDSGTGNNASVRVPLGFSSPYLIRATAYNSGSFHLGGELIFVASERCNWPAGCSLAVAVRGEATASETLRLLREVRSEVLSRSQRGRDLIDLYWRLGKDLIPELLTDSVFRQRALRDIVALLPLAREAVGASRGSGDHGTFTSAHVDRLHALLDLLTLHVSAEIAAELQDRWQEFALVEQVGLPFEEVLAEIELLPSPAGRTHKVIAKLRVEPTLDAKSGLLRTGTASVDARLTALGAQAVPVYHASPARRAAGLTRTISVELASLAVASALVAELRTDPGVEWAQVSAELRAYGPPGPDPFRGDLWGLEAIRAPEAWGASTGQCSTVVAVVDTGLRTEVADFEGRVLAHLGWDFVDDDPKPQDGHGHGTHVTGTVAAALDNSTSITGVAPGVCVFGVKVLGDDGSGDAEDVAEGIVHAVDAGARVINLSLGCDCETLEVIEDALEYAALHDVVVVAAAGNDSLDRLGYPASSIWALAVGAVDQSLELASFSNYGTGLDLVAPGVDVVSVFTDGESCSGSGTSMAAPHVSGVVALVRSRAPGLGREEVQDVLRQEAEDLGEPGYDIRFGAGLVDAHSAVNAVEPACDSGDCLFLLQNRFKVEVEWSDFDGNQGSGQVVPVGSDDSGLFYFFDPNNWEMLVKMIDGCSQNNHVWVFAAATTNVEYTLRVADAQTDTVTEYFNSLGNSADAIVDTEAFATCGEQAGSVTSSQGNVLSSIPPSSASPGPAISLSGEQSTCDDDATAVCLNQARFRVELDWHGFTGNQGPGRVVQFRSDDSGLFYFVDPNNWEILVKVLDGCGLNGNFWVFAAATTNFEYTLRVVDTETDAMKEYFNVLGNSASAITDTSAFATCP